MIRMDSSFLYLVSSSGVDGIDSSGRACPSFSLISFLTAWGKEMCSISMTKLITLPPLQQPWQYQRFLSVLTQNDGVLS